MSGLHFFRFALVAVALAGCRRPAVDPPPPAVRVVAAAARPVIDELFVSGTIEAIERAQLGFMVAGRVASVDVEDGDFVEAGRLLARLDDRDFANESAIALARRDEIRSRHARLARLHELGSLAASDFEKSRAALEEAEAALALSRQRWSYAELRAPFSGQVARHGVAAGTVVAPGTPVCALLRTDPVWANLSVPEVDVPRLQPGQAARITLAADPRTSAQGAIASLAPQAEAATRSFNAKVRLANGDRAFRPGNAIVARVTTNTRRAAVMLPPALVRTYPDGARFVWLLDETRSVLTRRLVTTGSLHDTDVEITSGLRAGECVVEAGATPFFEGMAVAPVEP